MEEPTNFEASDGTEFAPVSLAKASYKAQLVVSMGGFHTKGVG